MTEKGESRSQPGQPELTDLNGNQAQNGLRLNQLEGKSFGKPEEEGGQDEKKILTLVLANCLILALAGGLTGMTVGLKGGFNLAQLQGQSGHA